MTFSVLQDPLQSLQPAVSLAGVGGLSCKTALQPSPLFSPQANVPDGVFALPTASPQDSTSSSLLNSGILMKLKQSAELQRAAREESG